MNFMTLKIQSVCLFLSPPLEYKLHKVKDLISLVYPPLNCIAIARLYGRFLISIF